MTSAQSSSGDAEAAGRRQRSSHVERQRQVGRVLALVVIMFAVLWLPIHVHLLVVYFGTIPDTRFYEVTTPHARSLCLASSNKELIRR